jgi:phosphatidylglycerol:prolipoprotein diacylglycerol transferase
MFYDRPLDIFLPWVGGLVVLGSIVAVLIFAPLYLWLHNLELFPILDMVAVYAPLMQAVSRIGCFLAGCCYGIPAAKAAWWTVIFVDSEGIAPLNIALHPAQLYASLASLAVFFLLKSWVRIKKIKPGSPLFMFLFLESLARFFVDFLRGDRGDLIYVGLFGTTMGVSQVQIMSVGLCAISLVGLLIVSSRSTKLYSFED